MRWYCFNAAPKRVLEVINPVAPSLNKGLLKSHPLISHADVQAVNNTTVPHGTICVFLLTQQRQINGHENPGSWNLAHDPYHSLLLNAFAPRGNYEKCKYDFTILNMNKSVSNLFNDTKLPSSWPNYDIGLGNGLTAHRHQATAWANDD